MAAFDPDSVEARRRAGRELLESLRGEAPASALNEILEVAPAFADYLHEFVYGEVFSRPGLTPRDRIISTLSCLVTLGGMERPIELYVDMGLNSGMAPAEIVEVLLQCLSLAGFPRVQSGLLAARRVFLRRGLIGSAGADLAPEGGAD
ncbi:MAG: carboxymuconolactone decarboxylase family protein [Solirubrobacteraceae bacterium]|nr:carboxymuconolactone decarboxylase family protein [Solirubrobacteraceae bacterium]